MAELEQPQGDSEAGLLERLSNAMEPEAPEPENVEASEQEEVDADEQPETEAEEAEDDGLVELELEDGETLKVPQKLKDGYLRQADYTRKTQEVAARALQATAALEQQALVVQFQEATKEDQQRLSQIQSELQRFKALDWQNLDTETYIKTRGYMDQLKDQASDLEKEIGKKATHFQQEVAKRDAFAAHNAYQIIGQHVPGWKPDSATEKEVASYANNFGVPPEALAKVAKLYPGFAIFAAKAAQYDKLQSTKGAAVQKVQKAPPVVKPGAVTSTNTATAQKDKVIRDKFKKSGDTKDLAKLLLARNWVK